METTLFDQESGKEATTIERKGGEAFRKRVASLNIRAGKTIPKITTEPFHAPVVIEIGNTEATIVMEMAKKIVVTPLRAE